MRSRLRARITPAWIGLACLVVVTACAKKSAAPSDVGRVCGQITLRLQGWDSRLDDPQLDCPRLQLIGRDAVAFAKALHESVMKDKGEHGEAMSLVTDLETSTAAWAGELEKCHGADSWTEQRAIVKAAADKVRAALASDRDRVKARCGGRGAS